MCIMDRRDMQLLVKHIYFILYNPNKGKVTFYKLLYYKLPYIMETKKCVEIMNNYGL